jgi:predicted O-methyltransferase YrrM
VTTNQDTDREAKGLEGELDLVDLITAVGERIHREGRDYWWFKAHINDAFEQCGLRIQPDHFYAPLPSLKRVENYDWNLRKFPLEKLNFNKEYWIDILQYIGSGAAEDLASKSFKALGLDQFPWDNQLYTGLDALVLYALVRKLKPRRVIEIGSGYSTHVTLAALKENACGSLTCIEPYPTDILKSVSDEISIEVKEIQDVETDIFCSLTPNDIVFVDSSHVSAFQSDVNFEILELFPLIPKGVVVHVHDIFFPYEYPRGWIEERRWYWNEQYMLYAFLLQNPCWEIIFPSHYTLNCGIDRLVQMPADVPSPLTGSSCWLLRTG